MLTLPEFNKGVEVLTRTSGYSMENWAILWPVTITKQNTQMGEKNSNARNGPNKE